MTINNITNFADIVTYQAKKQPDAIAIYTSEKSISYQTLENNVWEIATYLSSRNVQEGDVVIHRFDDEFLLVVTMLATARLGATLLSIANNMPALLLEEIINKVRPSFLITDVNETHSIPLSSIIISHQILNASLSDIDYTLHVHSPKSPWQIIVGSGSTGKQKLFAITHEQENTRLAQSKHWFPIAKDDRLASFSALTYSATKRRFCETLTAGASYVVLEKNQNFIKVCQQHQITILYSTVFHITKILENITDNVKGVFKSLKVLSLGAGAVNDNLRERIRTYLSPNLYVRYGVNEIGSISNAHSDQILSTSGTVGTPIKGVTVEIVDDYGRRKSPDTIGVIRIKSPGAVDGYIDDEEATNKAFKDGWFYPGDLGKFTEDGQIIHMGRSDHMMIMNGINIYPAEIEQVMTSHPDVEDAAAMPIKSAIHQDIPICAVVLKKDTKVNEKLLIQYSRERLGSRAPKKIVILDFIPKNEQGKLIRKDLENKIKMQLSNTEIFYGPNPYTTFPIVIYNIKLKESEYLIAKNVCSKIINLFSKYFIEVDFNSLKPKEYIGMVLSHLAKSILNDNNGSIQDSGTTTNSEGFFIWVEFHHLEVTNQAIQLVLKIFQSLLRENKLNNDVKTSLNYFNKICKQYYSSSTQLIQRAQALDIPVFPHSINSNYWQFGWGKQSRVFYKGSSMEDSHHGVKHSMNKITSIEILRGIGVPTAKSVSISKIEQLDYAIKSIGYPCVIKPIKGAQGTGVTSNIQNYNELQAAYKYAKESKFGQSNILLETFIQGDDYRITVANGKFLGVEKRKPSYVVGTGKSTLNELIYMLNKTRVNLELNPNNLKPIAINDFLITYLSKQLVYLEDIIEKNRIITLNNVANYSLGGILEDVTDLTHPLIKKMAELIAKTSGIAHLGVDYITTDISKSYHEVNGAVIEYNHLPALNFAYSLLNSRDILNSILNIGSGRIPLIIAIINNSKFSQVQICCKENIDDQTIGWVCEDNVYSGQLPLHVIDTSGWTTIKMLLRNKTVEKVLVICSDDQIMEKGLPVDKADYICTCDVNLTSEWDKVIDKSTPQVKEFTNIETLLSFTLAKISDISSSVK